MQPVVGGGHRGLLVMVESRRLGGISRGERGATGAAAWFGELCTGAAGKPGPPLRRPCSRRGRDRALVAIATPYLWALHFSYLFGVCVLCLRPLTLQAHQGLSRLCTNHAIVVADIVRIVLRPGAGPGSPIG